MAQFNLTEITKFGLKWKRFQSANGRAVFYNARLDDLFIDLEKGKNVNYHYLYIFNRISTLKSGSWVLHSSHKTGNNNVYELSVAGSEVYYFMEMGIAYITHLNLEDLDYEQDIDENIMAGLYLAERTEDETGFQISGSLKRLTTLHATVNGDVNDIAEVMNYMPKMIADGHTTDTGIINHQGFSLFYTPSKKGKDNGWTRIKDKMSASTTKQAKRLAENTIVERLAASIQLATKQQVCWTIQGSGSVVFVQALEKLTTIQALDGKALDLSTHSAVFYNPHTSTAIINKAVENVFLGGQDDKGNVINKTKVNTNLYSASQMKSNAFNEPRAMTIRVMDQIKTGSLLIGIGTGSYLSTTYLMNNDWSAMTNHVSQWGSTNSIYAMLAAAGSLTMLSVGFVLAKGPKANALANLAIANFSRNRRFLDQLTTSSAVTAADQLKLLKDGDFLTFETRTTV
ncbi:MAG: hypothetical protein BMS9Abin31_1312 [Gammaproteobacteria bacterium]|nr:MAG: hypothetical protein BMS9Abin31_1312 [Gammaproteobacteria bacterium]